MKLEFEYRGQTHTLTKHPTVRQALKQAHLAVVAATTDAERVIAQSHYTECQAVARRKAWYLRPTWRANRPFKLGTDDADAIRAAKDILKGRTDRPEQFSAWIEEQDKKRGVTIGQLAEEWLKAGCPFDDEAPRTVEAAKQLKGTINRCLFFWSDVRALNITHKTMSEYCGVRRAQCKVVAGVSESGSRSVDIELSALSSLCQWAVLVERLKENPFATRKRFQDTESVRHCHQFAPETDEELHRILGWFFTHQYDQKAIRNHNQAADCDRVTRVCGAWLAFTALTGLRPEEPGYLYRHARLTTTPPKPAALLPGTIFPDRTGAWKMRVVRTKHGQNPFVSLSPVALDFLNVWTAWLDSTLGKSELARPWFPNPTDTEHPLCVGESHILNLRLAECCAQLKLPDRKPKGIGRAFYVAVRRSAGLDDATIASELGQTTNGKLIWSVYGNPEDLRGGALLDWIPEADGQPAPYAWASLQSAEQPSNVIALT